MKLRDYVLRRLILVIPVLLGVLAITFVVSRAIPADPVTMWLGGEKARADPKAVELVRKRLHLDEPIWLQFLFYISDVIHGNLGFSARTHRAIGGDLAGFYPASMELAVFAVILALAIGIPAGIISATHKDRVSDHLSRVGALLGVTMPNFWLALVLQLIFYYQLRWLPDPGGRINELVMTYHPVARVTGFMILDCIITQNWSALPDVLSHIILPAIVLGYAPAAQITRMTRSSMLEILRQDYIRTARAGGLSERIVIYKHALKNALIPTTTVAGMAIGGLLSGSVAVEAVFYWPGVGRYAAGSLVALDYPAVQGLALTTGFIYTMCNLIVDLLYGVLDPRVRYG